MHRKRKMYGGADANVPVEVPQAPPSEDQRLAEQELEVRRDPRCQLPTTYNANFPLQSNYGIKPDAENGRLLKFRMRGY